MPHFCNTMPMRSRSARPRRLRDRRRAPRPSPAVRSRKPSRISTIVVLPAPLGPRSANTSPSAISKLTPRTASSDPYDLWRSTTSNRGGHAVHRRTPFGAARAYASFQAERAPVPDDLALGLQLEQVRVHLAAGHLEQALGRVGVERGDDVGDLRRAFAERLQDLALAHLAVRHVLVEHAPPGPRSRRRARGRCARGGGSCAAARATRGTRPCRRRAAG